MSRVLAYFLISLAAVSARAQLPQSVVPVGIWEVEKFVDVLSISTSPQHIRQHLHRRLQISKTEVKFGKKTCPFEEQKILPTDEEATAYFLDDKMDYTPLNLHAPATVIEAECGTLIAWNGGEVFLVWDGDVYEIKKVETK